MPIVLNVLISPVQNGTFSGNSYFSFLGFWHRVKLRGFFQNSFLLKDHLLSALLIWTFTAAARNIELSDLATLKMLCYRSVPDWSDILGGHSGECLILAKKKIQLNQRHFDKIAFLGVCYVLSIHDRPGRKGVSFGNSLTASGVCHMGSKDEGVVKYFGKKFCLPMPNLIWNLFSKLL